MTTYNFIDNPTEVGVSDCDPDILNESIMHLKYSNIASSNNLGLIKVGTNLSITDGVLNSISQRFIYTVNSGKDSNGYADFIQKDSNTQITILAGGNNADLVLTYPDGTLERISSNIVVSSGLSSDGTYTIIKEKDNNTPVLVSGSNTVTESILNASGGTDGDYWLNYGIFPYSPKKKVSGNWTNKQFVKLGQVTKTGGTLGTPVSYAFNGQYKITTTCPQKITNTNFAHSIGSKNLRAFWKLICTSNEYNYVAGDEINSILTYYLGTYAYQMCPLIFTDINNLTFKTGGSSSSGLIILDKTSHTPYEATYTKWNLEINLLRGF